MTRSSRFNTRAADSVLINSSPSPHGDACFLSGPDGATFDLRVGGAAPDAPAVYSIDNPAVPAPSNKPRPQNLRVQRLSLEPLLQLSDWCRLAAAPSQHGATARRPPGRTPATLAQGPAALAADVACATMQGYAPGYKDANQDAGFVFSSFLHEGNLLVGVADGHGLTGQHVSGFFARHFPGLLLSQLRGSSGSSSSGDNGAAAATGWAAKGAGRGGGGGGEGCGAADADAIDDAVGSSSSNSEAVAHRQLQDGVRTAAALGRAIERADQLLERSGIDDDNNGSTAVVCMVHGDGLLSAAWVGDSRAVLAVRAAAGSGSGPAPAAGGGSSGINVSGSSSTSGSSGNRWAVAWHTQDHKPEDPAERRRIAAAGGRVARSVGPSGPQGPYRVWLADADMPGLAMSRALGDRPGRAAGITAHPATATLHLPPLGAQRRLSLPQGLRAQQEPAAISGSGSAAGGRPCPAAVLVVASDGVWEFLGNEDVAAIAGNAGSASEACQRILHRSASGWLREYGGQYVDDITVAVVRFEHV